jgi:anti-sigma B factor antagonist
MTTREVNGVSVVTLEGRIVFGEESHALRAKVKSLIAEGKQKIVLNMKNIEYIDSAGLGMLVAAYLSVKTHGASLCLCHLGSKFQEVLQINRLATVFQHGPYKGYRSASIVCRRTTLAPRRRRYGWI